MLAGLIRFSLTQRLLLLVLTVMLVGAGVQAFRGLPIDAFPDVSTTQVKIILKAPGMTPEEVETRLAVPVEQELLGIPHQRLLRSTSKYALTDITIDFEDGIDIYWARQQVGERLAAAMGNLPPGASGGMAPITTPLGEMFMFTIEGDLSLAEKRALLDWVIRPQLRTIPGVADVNSLGGEVRTFEVVPQPQSLAARGLALRDLQAVLETNNRNDGAGRLADGEESLLVRAEGAIRTVNDVKAIVLQARDGNVVRVGDVAEVRFGALTRYGAVTRNGQGEAVQGLVLGLRGANAQSVVAGVKARLAEIAPTLPQGVTIEPFYDRSNLVGRAVGTVAKALLEAIVLVVLLLLAFLGNLRAALVVALMLPLSALATFILMRMYGLSANLMSLGGLAIAIGMLVDAAVVVVENVESQLAEAQENLPTLHLIFRAASEVAAPVTSGIVIIIIVFLPLLTLQGLEGKMFGPVALTIVFALATFAAAVADRGAGAGLLPDQARRASRTLAGQEAGRRLRPRADLGPEPQPDLHARRPDRAGRSRRRLPAARQEFHADDGRRRPHHAAGETAVDRHRPDHRHRQPRAAGDSGAGAGGQGHRRPRRRRRTRPRPDGPQPDRHLHGAAAARYLAQSRPSLAGRPVARRDGRLSGHRFLRSPSRSTCACRKC